MGVVNATGAGVAGVGVGDTNATGAGVAGPGNGAGEGRGVAGRMAVAEALDLASLLPDGLY